VRTPTQWLARAWRVFADEFRHLEPRLRLARILVWPLPTLTLNRLRSTIYRAAGLRIGPGTLILGSIELTGEAGASGNLSVGKQVVINSPCYFDLNAPITLGDNVSIAHHVVFVTSSHSVGPSARRNGPMHASPITIGEGVWIGASVTILPGVTIGRGSIISAGSVVAADVPPNKLVGGVPARVIKALPEDP
jgi:acetyltransferase-like isoleucine patch superfamily enzyme